MSEVGDWEKGKRSSCSPWIGELASSFRRFTFDAKSSSSDRRRTGSGMPEASVLSFWRPLASARNSSTPPATRLAQCCGVRSQWPEEV